MSRLEDVAARLYSLPPAEFVAARKAAAADETGETAREIQQFTKPHAAAWAINLLAHDRADELGSLLELGDTLRRAQQELDRDALRQLTTQRRTLITTITQLAQQRAGEAGVKLSAASLRNVEETLQAGLADPAAGAALASGRLVRPLSSTGIEAVNLDDAVAGTPTAPLDSSRHTAGAASPSATSARARKAERERAEAQEAAEAILAIAERAAAELESARSEQTRLESTATDAAAEVDTVTEALARARTILDDAESAVRDGSRAVAAAERADASARREAERARNRLDTLG